VAQYFREQISNNGLNASLIKDYSERSRTHLEVPFERISYWTSRQVAIGGHEAMRLLKNGRGNVESWKFKVTTKFLSWKFTLKLILRDSLNFWTTKIWSYTVYITDYQQFETALFVIRTYSSNRLSQFPSLITERSTPVSFYEAVCSLCSRKSLVIGRSWPNLYHPFQPFSRVI